MKNPFKRSNTAVPSAATAIVTRHNREGQLYPPESSVNYESIVWSGEGTRYCDPLVRDHVINKALPAHRERVASEDPLGILVTRVHALMGWARAPKFYASDEQGAPEILPELRALLTTIHAWETCAEGTFETLKHGWAGLYTWLDVDENGQPALMSEIYSAKQISAEDIVRDDLNRPIAWLVRGRFPVVPAGYGSANLKVVHRTFRPGQPGWIVHTRGDYAKTLGYGYSRLVDLWDPITKLRITSHSDAKRNEIFPLVVYPSSWEDTAVDALFKSLAHVDENAGLAVKSAEDSEGNPVPGLPTIAWRSPAEDAPNVSGEGGPRGLPSEIVRFCALSGITIKELAGDPGGAQEAGATDVALALEKNIQEWNFSSRPLLEKLIRMLDMMGVLAQAGITLPPTFVIKGHWEWERDEMLVAQATMMDQQMENDTRDSESKERQSKQSKQNTDPYIEYGEVLALIDRENAPPAGVFAPITSSWVRGYGQTIDGQFIAEFHTDPGAYYLYPGLPGNETATGMESSGSPGGFVHDTPGFWKARGGAYQRMTNLPDDMAFWGGSQAAYEMEADEGHDIKVGQFGAARPAKAPNMHMYPQQTRALTEHTTRPMREKGYDLAGIQGQLRGMARSFNPVDFAAMAGKLPALGLGPRATNPMTEPAGQAPLATAGVPNLTGDTLQGAGREFGPGTGRGAPEHVWGKTFHDKRKAATKAGAGTTASPAIPVYDFGYNYTNTAIPVQRTNASLADLSYDKFNEAAKVLTGGHTFSKDTFTRFRAMLTGFVGLVQRSNHISHGNSMSFKDHPYKYVDGGEIVIEYPCGKDWRANVVGKTGRLKINPSDTSKHGDVVIGTITYGWNEEKGCPDDKCDYDRANVMHIIEAAGGTEHEVYRRLQEEIEPDRSTEYGCQIKRHNGRRWQVGFVPGDNGTFDTCLVDEGNCPSGECDFVPAERQD